MVWPEHGGFPDSPAGDRRDALAMERHDAAIVLSKRDRVARPARFGRLRLPFIGALVTAAILLAASVTFSSTAASARGPEAAPPQSSLDSEPANTKPVPELAPIGERVSAGLLDDLADEIEPATTGAEPEPGSSSDPTAKHVTPPGGPAHATPGVVRLTFDDGPHPGYTPAILDILARHDAKATFFVLGSLVEAHPGLFERIVAEGHTVANHSWNHTDLAGLSQAEFNESVGRTQVALGSHATSCLRPPFGSLGSNTRRWAAELGLDVVLWGTDTQDWQRPGVDAIADSIVRGASSSAPILLHDGGGDRTQTVLALDRAMSELSGRGLSFEPTC